MYLPYEPLSKKGDESTYVPEELSIAQKKAIKTIPKKITNIWDDWVCEQLQLTKEELFSFFSSEQIDSIGICIYNFQNKSNFIIGDETGIGKGSSKSIAKGDGRWSRGPISLGARSCALCSVRSSCSSSSRHCCDRDEWQDNNGQLPQRNSQRGRTYDRHVQHGNNRDCRGSEAK